jgi:diguanylate cyclase (GGDEF)-like protein
VLVMVGLGFVAFQLYLRRAMRYLDPSAAVPERVRTAFDTLTEALLVLDTHGRVMLANRAFGGLGPDGAAIRTGSSVNDLAWLVDAMPVGPALPWQRVLETNQPLLGLEIRLGVGSDRAREVVLNCTPINDGFKRARGCLITLSDVTELHERTEGLRVALAELHASREEIRIKNEELTLLATRDALTGCLNRRAFLADSERSIAAAAATGQPLCAIMCDVDHFKSINDRFGHGGGDEVLKAVAKALGRSLRVGDLLGRYGGEEFCIVLPDATLDQARVIAQRLRADVEANAGSAVRHLAVVKVTMSFGVEQLSADTAQFAALVDRADQALYHSKKTGRNRVTAWCELTSVPAAG